MNASYPVSYTHLDVYKRQPYTHRINPYLPLDKVNRVNNLISVHKKCSMAINTPGMDISDYERCV